MCWRVFVRGIKFFGEIAGVLFWRRMLRPAEAPGTRILAAAATALLLLSAAFPLMVPAQVRPQDFERLRMQVEAHHDRLGRMDSTLDSMKLDVAAIQLNMAENLGPIKSDINAMKWIGGLFGTILLACLPFAFKAGRWYQKTEHISGNHTPIR